MKKYSSFISLDEMLEKSPFKIESQEDFQKIDDAEWDIFIKNNTKFNSWEEMLSTASTIWVKKQLKL